MSIYQLFHYFPFSYYYNKPPNKCNLNMPRTIEMTDKRIPNLARDFNPRGKTLAMQFRIRDRMPKGTKIQFSHPNSGIKAMSVKIKDTTDIIKEMIPINDLSRLSLRVHVP